MTLKEQKAAFPKVAQVFDTVLIQYGRKKRPWLKFYDREFSELVDPLSTEEKDQYWLMERRFRHGEFDKLCNRLSKDGMIFDAWGPLNHPAFVQYKKKLSSVEWKELSEYMELRKERLIEIEGDVEFAHHYLNYTQLNWLLIEAKDDRQRFRYLASIVEYPGYEKLTPTQLAHVGSMYEDLAKRLFENPTPPPAITPLPFRGHVYTLTSLIEVLRTTKLLSVKHTEIVAHFDWQGKADLGDALRRYYDARREIKAKSNHVNSEAEPEVRALIEELGSTIEELQEVKTGLERYLPKKKRPNLG